mmetsp:Transcript_25177/g.72419  ORF Transcript_25177/g.72419 Transcript_25177/m.72419 type:complete len:88 (+) Transcript_25177:423-686(+)
MLDFDYPPDFMPRAMRDDPSHVLALDIDVDVAVRFDSKEPLFDLGAQPGLSDFTSVAAVDNDAPTSSSWLARRVGEVPRDQPRSAAV